MNSWIFIPSSKIMRGVEKYCDWNGGSTVARMSAETLVDVIVISLLSAARPIITTYGLRMLTFAINCDS